jgi:hypothetical protein
MRRVYFLRLSRKKWIFRAFRLSPVRQGKLREKDKAGGRYGVIGNELAPALGKEDQDEYWKAGGRRGVIGFFCWAREKI